MATIIDMTASGDEREFSLSASAHADVPQGPGQPHRPTIIQVRAARTPDGHTSADSRVLGGGYTWTTILSFTGDDVQIPGTHDGGSFDSSLADYARDLIGRTVKILSL